MALDGDRQSVIDHIEEEVGRALTLAGHSEVIDLSFEYDSRAIHKAGVETRLMYSWSEANVTEDGICMLLPEAGRFGAPLHCREDRDDMAWRYVRASFVVKPPLSKSLIWSDVVRGGSFTESVGNVRPVNEKVFGVGDGVE